MCEFQLRRMVAWPEDGDHHAIWKTARRSGSIRVEEMAAVSEEYKMSRLRNELVKPSIFGPTWDEDNDCATVILRRPVGFFHPVVNLAKRRITPTDRTKGPNRLEAVGLPRDVMAAFGGLSVGAHIEREWAKSLRIAIDDAPWRCFSGIAIAVKSSVR